MSLLLEPCGWEISFTGCSEAEVTRIMGDLGPTAAAQVQSAAVEYLWNWTGRRFGVCDMALSVCLSCSGEAPSPFSRVLPAAGVSSYPNGLLGALSSCCGRTACGCGDGPDLLRLPGPIVEVVKVTVGEEILPSSAYQIINSAYLRRIDGEDWPTCSDGELVIEYRRGYPVPQGGKIAAGALTLELAKALCRDNTCRLPQRMQSITRQGVTATIIDPFEGLDSGKTGLWVVDSWVHSIRETGQVRSKVLSPDVPRPGQNRSIR